MTDLTEKKDYESATFELIGLSNILKEEDFDELREMRDELNHVFLHSQMFRTRTEMEISVLNEVKFPTPDAKYWQAIREQNVMFQQLVLLSYEYRKTLVDLERQKRKLNRLESTFKNIDKSLNDENLDLDIEETKIEIEKLHFAALNQERTAKDRIREIKEWHQIKEKLIPQLKYSLDDVDEHQLLSYTSRFIRQAAVMGDSGSPAENQNLLGQLKTALNVVQEKRLVGKLLDTFSENDRKKIEKNFNLLPDDREDLQQLPAEQTE